MTDVDRTSSADGPPPTEVDRLLSRIVDGEASADDRAAFDRQAAVDPGLWRQLAAAQQEMTLLAAGLEAEVASAMQVDLPSDPPEVIIGRVDESQAGGALRGAGTSVAWLAAMVGWAAVLVLSVVLAISGAMQTPPATSGGTPVGGDGTPTTFTPEQHWRLYLQAPFVSEELAPMIRESEPLADGGIRLHIIRRIEETYDLTPEQAATMLQGLDDLIGGELESQREQLDAIRREIQQQAENPSQY